MRQRERANDERHQAGGGTAGGDNLDGLSTEATRLLAAGDEAIERALSGNSEAFLAANRQHGGQ